MNRSEVFPLIFILVFLSFLTIVLGIFSTSFNMGGQFQSAQQSAINKFTDISIDTTAQNSNFFISNDNSGLATNNPYRYQYNVTPPDRGTYFGVGALGNLWTDAKNMYFIDSTDSSIGINVYLIKAPSMVEPQLVFYQHWGWWSHKQTYITMSEILSNYGNHSGNQYAKVEFNLKTGYSIYVVPANNTSLQADIQASNNFHLRISVSAFNSTKSGADAFGLVGQLLTFSIPGMNPILGGLLGTMIWIMGTFLIIRFIMMFIPFISGGS